MVRKVGVVGYGNIGKFLASEIQASSDLELVFIWNRTLSVLSGIFDSEIILEDLNDFKSKHPDIVVEVCHPSITKKYGSAFLEFCDYMVGSPTALCDDDVRENLIKPSVLHGLYIPSGALWGGDDLQKLDNTGALKELKVTMKKHPSSLFLKGNLKEINDLVKDAPLTIYNGPVRGICSLAPHNTNTMAAAAIIAKSLGFDGVQGCLISDPSLVNSHIVEVTASGYPTPNGCFSVHTVRKNPAGIGQVTGKATYGSFWESLKRAQGKGPGIHIC